MLTSRHLPAYAFAGEEEGAEIMIGLGIRVKNAPDNLLYKIFSGISVSEYIWEISEEEIMYSENNEHKQKLFGNSILSGDEFLKCISRDSYYMIFANIKAYPIESNRTNINTYKDYLESSCKIILLCADSTFIDFYSKAPSILKKVQENCIINHFEQVNILTEENDTRTRMSV